MLIRLFQVFFGKIIGLDRIPQERRDKYADLAIKLASELVKAGAEGAVKGIMENGGEKFKYNLEKI